MKRLLLPIALLLLTFHATAHAENGLVSVKSSHDVPATADRLVGALEEKGLTIFARIDHAAGAEKVGMSLAPTKLIIFGNPKSGTPLMHCNRTVAIDLPLKALIWQDDEGEVWLTYNDPGYLDRRHELTGCDKVLGNISKALAGFAEAATGK
ncbi:MAG: DUF302 domain-containing protein [Pseudomonadota bacterium]|nr:DUF302 domain-containing protein [Pseudomonadota bacterium]